MSDCFDHLTEAYESRDWSIFEDGPSDFYVAAPFRCWRCHKDGLTWAKNANGKWQPHQGGVPHSCATNCAADFEVIP